MVYQGHVENGMIRLQDPVVLPEGATVNVEVVPPRLRPNAKSRV